MSWQSDRELINLWIKLYRQVKHNVSSFCPEARDVESICYLRGDRFHFAFFLLILLVGPQIDGKLFTPPVNKDKHISRVGNRSCRFSTVSYWPVNDLFIVTADEYLLLRRDDAESVSLARPGLGITDVCAQIHVHGPLWQSAWLEKNQNTSKLFR